VSAGGGEYPLQDGFGWTNGVLRALLVMYPQSAQTARPSDIPEGPAGVSSAAASAAAASKNTHRLHGTRVNP
jgi:alpha,alpha-trehalase